MIFGDLGGLKLTGEENPRKNITQETCPNRGSNPDPLYDRRACYRLAHDGGMIENVRRKYNVIYGKKIKNRKML